MRKRVSQHPSADKKDFSLKVTQQKYTCDTSYGVSNHKPVISTFKREVSAVFTQKKCKPNAVILFEQILTNIVMLIW